MADRASRRPGAAPTFGFHIEELILHGFEPIHRYEVAAAIERELARLLHEPAVQQRLLGRHAAVDESAPQRLDAGSFIVPHDATPGAVGAQVAQAIYRRLTPSGASAVDARQSSSPAQSRTGLPSR
jgi:hypothetical protein